MVAQNELDALQSTSIQGGPKK